MSVGEFNTHSADDWRALAREAREDARVHACAEDWTLAETLRALALHAEKIAVLIDSRPREAAP